jgi:hypothetical protein
MADEFLKQLMFFRQPEERQDYVSLPSGSVETIRDVRRERKAPPQKPQPVASAPIHPQAPVEPMPQAPQQQGPFSEQAYEDHMNEVLAEKRGSIEGIQKQIDQLDKAAHWSDKINLRPIAAYVDSVAGTNMAQSFRGTTPEEERMAIRQKLQEALNRQEDQYANQALSFFRNKAYMDQVKAQEENAQANREFDRWFKKENLKLRRENQERRGRSVGQAALDKAFAKTYEEDFVDGKVTTAEKNLDSLLGVGQRLQAAQHGGADLTGGMIGMQPMFYRRLFNQESADAQQTVEEVVQQSLKAILGAQFTEKEAARLIERAYDPALDESYNEERVARLYNALKQGLERRRAAARYWEKHGGTLSGFPASEMVATNAKDYVDSVLQDIDGDQKKSAAPSEPDLENMTDEELEAFVNGN